MLICKNAEQLLLGRTIKSRRGYREPPSTGQGAAGSDGEVAGRELKDWSIINGSLVGDVLSRARLWGGAGGVLNGITKSVGSAVPGPLLLQ